MVISVSSHFIDVVVCGFHIIVVFVGHGFRIRVMFVGRGFYVSVNVSEVIFLMIRLDRKGRRDNSNCFVGGCRSGAFVCGGRHCE